MVDKYELLELFENEPRIIDDEAGLYEYQRIDPFGFTFRLYLSLYDSYCSVRLSYTNFANPIFDLGFDNVEKILCRPDKLIIQQKNNPQDTVMYFKPTYTLKTEPHIE